MTRLYCRAIVRRLTDAGAKWRTTLAEEDLDPRVGGSRRAREEGGP
jgi:hypothetical protein